MDLSLSIQFAVVAVPGRMPYVEKFILPFVPGNTRVFIDRDKQGNWYNFHRAWGWLAGRDSDYVISLQDDITLCDDFIPSVTGALLAAYPEPVSFFNMRKVIAGRVVSDNGHWFKSAYPLMGQALAFTPDFLSQAISWIDSYPFPDNAYEDLRLAVYFSNQRHYMYHTVPCLVEHAGYNQSLLGISGKVGNNYRRASVYSQSVNVNWAAGFDTAPDDGYKSRFVLEAR